MSVGPPYQIINHWRKQNFVMVVSPQLLSEYEEVMNRPEITKYTGLNPKETTCYITEVKNRAHVTKGELTLNILEGDPDDNMVLACAQEGSATHLVTGNRKHFPFTEYKGIQIVSPREFLSFLPNVLT